MKRIKPGSTFVSRRWPALLGALGLSLLLASAASATPIVTSSLKSLVLPHTDTARIIEPLPAQLQPPLGVGVALTPPINPVGTVYYKDQVNLLQAVADRLSKSRYVSHTEIIPNHYVKRCQNFSCFSAIEKQFDVQAIALVSYDQIQFRADDHATRQLNLLTGKQLFEGRPGEIHTRVNTSIFTTRDQHFLLSASGFQVTRTVSGQPPESNEPALKLKRAQRAMVKNLRRQLRLGPIIAPAAAELPPTDIDQEAATAPTTAVATDLGQTSHSTSTKDNAQADITQAEMAPPQHGENPNAVVDDDHLPASATSPKPAATAQQNPSVVETAKTIAPSETQQTLDPLTTPRPPATRPVQATPESLEPPQTLATAGRRPEPSPAPRQVEANQALPEQETQTTIDVPKPQETLKTRASTTSRSSDDTIKDPAIVDPPKNASSHSPITEQQVEPQIPAEPPDKQRGNGEVNLYFVILVLLVSARRYWQPRCF